MSISYSILIDRIRRELGDLDKTVQRVERAWKEAESHPSEEDLLLDSVALNLHAFYSGIESLLEHIARSVDGTRPNGQAWHRQLLVQMANEMPPRRPAVISEKTCKSLDEYRRLRHLVRNVYAINLRSDRLSSLVKELPEVWELARIELTAFADFLQAQSGEEEEDMSRTEK